jgi:Sigma-70 region 2
LPLLRLPVTTAPVGLPCGRRAHGARTTHRSPVGPQHRTPRREIGTSGAVFGRDRPSGMLAGWTEGPVVRCRSNGCELRTSWCNRTHVMDGTHRRDDAELVAAVLAGDREAFGPLLARWQASVLRLCRRLLGSGPQAEDVAQEAAVQAFVGLPRLADPSRSGAWLLAIAANLARMALRRRHLLALDGLPADAAGLRGARSVPPLRTRGPTVRSTRRSWPPCGSCPPPLARRSSASTCRATATKNWPNSSTSHSAPCGAGCITAGAGCGGNFGR